MTKTTTVAMAMLAVGATAGADERLRGPGFSVPVPSGYADGKSEVPANNVPVVLLQKQRIAPDYFRASVVVTPIPPSNPPLQPADAKMCSDLGALMAQQTKSTLQRALIVDGPTGKTCQFSIAGPRQSATGTVVKGPASAWMLTCNYDLRDKAAITACAQTLMGWKFD